MQAQYSATQFVAPDSMSAVAHHVDREYGCHGYRIGIALAGYRVAVFEVRCSDGGTFNVMADRWGNVQRIPDDATAEVADELVSDFAKMAATS